MLGLSQERKLGRIISLD